jgi:hypothetical protein
MAVKLKFIKTKTYEEIKNKMNNSSTITAGGSLFHSLREEALFKNPTLNLKLMSVGVWSSKVSSTLTYEVVRHDPKDAPNSINIERYFISALIGGTASVTGPIKDFPEHHSSTLPPWHKMVTKS